MLCQQKYFYKQSTKHQNTTPMLIFKKNLPFRFAVLFVVTLLIASCNTSNHTRSGKYSSSNKRQAKTYVSKERKTTKKPEAKVNNTKQTSYPAEDLRASIVGYALQFKGTKYRYGGKSPETGFDCSGFTGYVFSQHGIPVSGPSNQLAQLGRPKSMNQLMPGDLVFFGDKSKISHVGIVANRSSNQIQVVHATTSAGVKVDEILGSEYWTTRFLYGRDLITK